MNRFDALSVREYEDNNGDKKTSWTRIGVAFPLREGNGYSIFLDAMPAPVKGQYKIILRPPLPKDGDRQTGGGASQPAEDLSDDIPFIAPVDLDRKRGFRA